MNTAEVQEKIRQMESPDEEVDLDGDLVTVSTIELAELHQQVEVADLHHFDVLEDVRKMKEATAYITGALESRIHDLEIERDLQEEDWSRRSVTRAGLEKLRLQQDQEEASKDREVEALKTKVEALRREWSHIRFVDGLREEAELATDEARKWDGENRRLREELAALEYEVMWDVNEVHDLQVLHRDLMQRTMVLEQEARRQAVELQTHRSGNMELGIRVEWLEAKWAELKRAQESETLSAETSGAEVLVPDLN